MSSFTITPSAIIARGPDDIAALMRAASLVPGAKIRGPGHVGGARHALAAVAEMVKPGSAPPSLPLDAVKLVAPNSLLAPYQQQGHCFMYMTPGVLNNDDVGLGKTVQTIAAYGDEGNLKVILCPASLKTQWKGEIERWTPKLFNRPGNVQVIYPASDKRSKVIPSSPPEWIVAFYLDASRAREIVASLRSRFILIIDEIHNLRGYKAKRVEAVKGLSLFASKRAGLTASLLYNDAARLHPILDLVEPGAWGGFTAFASRYASAKQGEYGLITGPLSNERELRARLAFMSFRRTRDEVADQLPFETVFQTINLDIPLDAVERAAFTDPTKHRLLVSSIKNPVVAEQVATDRGAGLPSLVYTYTKEQARQLAALIPESLLITGDMSATDRTSRIAEYAQAQSLRPGALPPCVVATIDSLSEGVNLQWAKTVNFAALDWTPEKMHQAIGRAARMGQTGTVQVRFFVVKGSMDERIIQVILSKLTEQTKLRGKAESSKTKMLSALGPAEEKDVLESMYERLCAEEGLSC